MANPTMTLIASNTVGSGGVSSVTFSSIPATWTDLVVKFSTRTTISGISDDVYMYPNGLSTNSSGIQIGGTGAGTFSNSNTYAGGFTDGSTATSNTFANTEIYIPNYTSSNYKSHSTDTVLENNATASYMALQAGLWSNTAAITSLQILAPNGVFVQYSTFYLYGIASS